MKTNPFAKMFFHPFDLGLERTPMQALGFNLVISLIVCAGAITFYLLVLGLTVNFFPHLIDRVIIFMTLIEMCFFGIICFLISKKIYREKNLPRSGLNLIMLAVSLVAGVFGVGFFVTSFYFGTRKNFRRSLAESFKV